MDRAQPARHAVTLLEVLDVGGTAVQRALIREAAQLVRLQIRRRREGDGREAQSTSRAVVQVLRLALCFALLDCSPGLIEVDHLLAAVGVWRYAESSARYVFRRSCGTSGGRGCRGSAGVYRGGR